MSFPHILPSAVLIAVSLMTAESEERNSERDRWQEYDIGTTTKLTT